MIPLVAILAWLPMPLDAVTAVDADDWYAPVEFTYVDHEPTLNEIDEKIRLYELKQRYRIMENRDDR